MITCRKLLSIIIGVLLYGSDAMFMSAIVPIFPLAAERRGISSFWIGLVFSSMYVSVFIGSFIWPMVLKPRHYVQAYVFSGFLVGISFFCFGCIIFVESSNLFIASCVATRVLGGISMSLMYACAIPVITNINPENSGITITAMQTAAYIGVSLGPGVASALFSIGGYYLPFTTLGILVITLSFLAWIFFCTANVNLENKKETGKINRYDFFTFITRPWVMGIALPAFCDGLFTGIIVSTLTIYIKDVFLLDETNNYIVYLTYGLSFTIISPIVGIIIDKGYASAIMVFAIVLLPSSFFAMVYIKSLYLFIVAFAGKSIAGGMISSVSMLYFIKSAEKCNFEDPSHNKLLSTSLFSSIRVVSRALGASVLGGIVLEYVSIKTVWTIGASFIALSSILAMVVMKYLNFYTRLYYTI